MVALLALIAIGFLVACSTKYKSVSNGLVVVPTQASPVMQTFSLDLSNGHVSQINNVNGPPVPGLPTAVVLDPAGTFAYVVVNQNATFPGVTGIVSFKVGSDGKLAAGTASPPLQPESPTVNAPCVTANSQTVPIAVTPTPVVPGALVIDSAGKYLFVADVSTTGQTQPYQCNGATLTATVAVPGAVSVFSVSNGTLTEVAGSPFILPNEVSGSGSNAISGSAANATALAITPTVFPVQYAACSGHTPPTTENLYVTDSANDVVLNYSSSAVWRANAGSCYDFRCQDFCDRHHSFWRRSRRLRSIRLCSQCHVQQRQRFYYLQCGYAELPPGRLQPASGFWFAVPRRRCAWSDCSRSIREVRIRRGYGVQPALGISNQSVQRIADRNCQHSGGDELRSELDCNSQRWQLDFRGQLQFRDRVAIRYHSGHWTVDPAIAVYDIELSLWSGGEIG